MTCVLRTIVLILCLTASIDAASPTTQPLRFSVVQPDGKPAAGAKAVFVPADRALIVSDGKSFDDDPAYTLASADEQGKVTLPRATASGPFAVCVVHDNGTTDFTDADMPTHGVIRLTPWASVSGIIKYGPNLQAGEQCLIDTTRPLRRANGSDPHPPRVSYFTLVTTAADGTFHADRIPAGETLFRPSRKTAAIRPLESRRAFFTLKAGERKTVTVGDHGRAVVGRIAVPTSIAKAGEFSMESADIDPAVPPRPPTPARPAGMSLEQYKQWAALPEVVAAREKIEVWGTANNAMYATRHQEAEVQPDGTFRGEDLEPGDYRLFVYIGTPWRPNGTREYLAEAQVNFTVPAEDAGMAPIDIGTLVAECKTEVGKIVIGEPGTDFVVPNLNGGQIRLADYRGRFVLLNFWATWCGPCMAEVPNLKAVWAKYGHDPRFAMIDLCCDDEPGYPQKVIRDAGLEWSQGFLGGTDDPVQAVYGIGGWPAILLIGPDGKIIASGLRGEQIEKTIAEKLSSGR